MIENKVQLHTGWTAKKNVNTVDKGRSKIVRNRVVDWHFSPNWRQKEIENTVSSNF